MFYSKGNLLYSKVNLFLLPFRHAFIHIPRVETLALQPVTSGSSPFTTGYADPDVLRRELQKQVCSILRLGAQMP